MVEYLLAITISAVFQSRGLQPIFLLLALVPLGLFVLLVQRRVRSWQLLIPLAAATWTPVHASGVHATVAVVLPAYTVPVIRSQAAGGPDAGPGLAEDLALPQARIYAHPPPRNALSQNGLLAVVARGSEFLAEESRRADVLRHVA